MKKYKVIAGKICKYSKRSFMRKFVSATGGNISMRLPNNEEFLITPSGLSLYDLSPEQLVHLNSESIVLNNTSYKPSKESSLHLVIYKNKPNVNAIIHVHPICCIVLSIMEKIIPLVTISAERKIVQSKFVVGKYDPGSELLCQQVEKALETIKQDNGIILLKAHGVISFGENLEDVFNNIDLAEDTAKIFLEVENLRNKLTKSNLHQKNLLFS